MHQSRSKCFIIPLSFHIVIKKMFCCDCVWYDEYLGRIYPKMKNWIFLFWFFLNIHHTKHNQDKHFLMKLWKERGVTEHLVLDWKIKVHKNYSLSCHIKSNTSNVFLSHVHLHTTRVLVVPRPWNQLNANRDMEKALLLSFITIHTKPLEKSLETFFTLPFLIYSIPICKTYEVNHLACFFISKMTPSRLQSDDPGLNNSPEQADGSQSKSDKIAIILDNIYPFNH